MAEETKDKEVTVKKEVSIEKDKPTETGGETTTAPATDKPADAPEAEDFSAVINVLNSVSQEVLGGKGDITEIPENAQAAIKYIIENMVFMRDLYEDPLWSKIMDDLFDQKEEGKVPSVLVAFARNVPMSELEALADNEDYAGAQQDLSDRLAQVKADEEAMVAEEVAIGEGFEASRQAGMDYAEKMGYSEEETNQLFDEMLQLYKILGDGKLTEAEWEKFDKMRNYDTDMGDMRKQLEELNAGSTKEVLPDQSSVDATVETTKTVKKPVNTPGMGSMTNFEEPAYLKTGKSRFGGK